MIEPSGERGEPDAGHSFRPCPSDQCNLHGIIDEWSCHTQMRPGYWCGYAEEQHSRGLDPTEVKRIPRAARRQILAAAKLLRGISIAKIKADTYACLGCGASGQEDCADGCWAQMVERSAADLADLVGLRHG